MSRVLFHRSFVMEREMQKQVCGELLGVGGVVVVGGTRYR